MRAFDQGYADGYEVGQMERGGGWPPPRAETPYGQGFYDGYTDAQREGI